MCLEKPQEDLAEYIGEPDEYLSLDVDKFQAAFENFLQRKKRLEEIRVHHKRSEKQKLTTEIRMESITNFFRNNDLRETDFGRLVQQKDDRYDVAVTFSSVLEMMKQKKLDAHQKYIFGNIRVEATDELFDQTNAASEEGKA